MTLMTEIEAVVGHQKGGHGRPRRFMPRPWKVGRESDIVDLRWQKVVFWEGNFGKNGIHTKMSIVFEKDPGSTDYIARKPAR